MKIVGIVCSPRIGGNTEILVREVLKSASQRGADVEVLTIADKTISPCNACNACERRDVCKIDDDMQEIYKKLLEADGVIFGTPVYYWSVSAQAKALIDRTYALHWDRKLKDKIGGVVVVAQSAGRTNAFSVFNNFFVIHKIRMAGHVFGYGDKRGDVKQDENAMKDAEALGKSIVEHIKMLEKII